MNFSIIIPCFNSEKTILKALDSLKIQTYRDFEAIIINDGSTDNTKNLLDTYSFNYPVKIITQSNEGLASSRNRGINAADGNYVCFLDSDDYWLANKLEVISKAILSGKKDLLCHDEYLMYKNKILSVQKYGPYSKHEDLLFKKNCLSPSAVVINTEIIRKAGGFIVGAKSNGVEDYDLWMRLALEGIEFTYLHEPLGVCVKHESNMSSAKDYRDREDYVLGLHYELYDKRDNKYIHLIRRRQSIQYAARGWDEFNNRNYSEAYSHYWHAMKMNIYSPKLWKYLLLGPLYSLFLKK